MTQEHDDRNSCSRRHSNYNYFAVGPDVGLVCHYQDFHLVDQTFTLKLRAKPKCELNYVYKHYL